MYRNKAKAIAGILFILVIAPAVYVTTEIFVMRANELREIPPPQAVTPPTPKVEPKQPDLYVAPAPIKYPFY